MGPKWTPEGSNNRKSRGRRSRDEEIVTVGLVDKYDSVSRSYRANEFFLP